MAGQDIREETFETYFLIISNHILGLSTNFKISLPILVMVIVCLYFKIRSIFLADGITNPNSRIFLISYPKLKCGRTHKLAHLYLLGIMHRYWFKPFQLGNTLFLEVVLEIFHKDQSEVCLNFLTKHIFLI